MGADAEGARLSDFIEMPSGILIPQLEAERQALKGCRPKAVDLFCGCGGFSLGFMQSGFEVVAAVDNDTDAAMTYTMNLGAHPMQFVFVDDADRRGLEKSLTKKYKRADRSQIDAFEVSGSGWISTHPEVPGVGVFFLGDICKIKGRDILDAVELEVGELDAVIGSPPCQGFSRANANRGPNDLRNELVWEFARLIVEMQPKTMCLENVPEIATMTTPEGLLVLDVFCRILEDGNFAGVDAMRHAMKHQAGITLMRGRGKRPKRTRKTTTEVQACSS